MLRTVKTVNEINHARLLCVVLTSAGVLTDGRDIAVERYERQDMHTLQLGVYKWCRSLEGLCS